MLETVCPSGRAEYQSAAFNGSKSTVQRTICAAYSPIAPLTLSEQECDGSNMVAIPLPEENSET